jgi:hypothetical protein
MKSIRISNDVYLHIYTHNLKLDLLEVCDISDDIPISYNKIAKDFLDSFDDESCVQLWDDLAIECMKRIVEHWSKYAPIQLENKHYKKYKTMVEYETED